MKACIVIPTIREACIRAFLEAWEGEFKSHSVIVVEDNPERSFDLPSWVSHYSWKEIDADLGAYAWIIPRRTGAIRNYGILAAGRENPNMIVMLDDDCLPSARRFGFLRAHWEALCAPGIEAPVLDTMHSSGAPIRPRGFPRDVRKIQTVVNHGLWDNIPDLDGETQLQHPDFRSSFGDESIQVPNGTYFPLSAMNVAFRPEILPAMYQLPMGQDQPYHRFDDIWCGWIMKKACDQMALSVRSGAPAIWHSRASDASRNAELEAPGLLENERVFQLIRQMYPVRRSLDDCLDAIHEGLRSLGNYWVKAGKAASIWRSLVRAARMASVA